MHNWGDENVDWNGIGEAAHFLASYMKKWGRMGVRDWKEKYGTVRVYVDMGWYSLLSVTHPGWCHYRPYTEFENKIKKYIPFTKKLSMIWLDIYVFGKVVRLLNPIVSRYHCWLYTRAYGLAIRKWPHLRMEILSGADHHELLKKFGVHTIRKSDRSYEIHYDWSPQDFVYPKEEEYPWFERGMSEMWKFLNDQSPATSIVLNQDYEGVIKLKLKYPSEDVREYTGFTDPRMALLAAVDQIVDEKDKANGSIQEV